MPKTAVVNPRRKKRKKSAGGSKRRRRNYGAAAARAPNPRRRRRARASSGGGYRRRRRNPSYPAQRRSNPGTFDFDNLVDTLPAATGGVFAARYATKLAGKFEDGKPGIKHAIAIWIAAQFGGKMLGDLLGSSSKGEYARIAALGFGGDLFARTRFLNENKWVNENLSLSGVDADAVYDYSEGADLNGFQQGSQLGDSFVDAVGNRYVQTAQGWALAGVGAELVQDDSGNVYALEGGDSGTYRYPGDYDAVMEDSRYTMSGFQQGSQLGFARRSRGSSSFGYA
jgi:hypothetical protein